MFFLKVTIDEQLVKRAREAARKRGTTLNKLICDYLRMLTGDSDPEATVRELQSLWDKTPALAPSDYKIRREDAYEERLSRFKK